MYVQDMNEKIRDGLLECLKDTPAGKVTVGQISSAAGVSRQTFYYHFDNIFDIFKWSVRSKYEPLWVGEGADPTFQATLAGWYRSFRQNKDLTIAFVNSPYAIDVLRFIKGELMPAAMASIPRRLGRELDPEQTRVCATFLVSANLGILQDWISNSMETPIKDVYDAIDEVIVSAMNPEIVARFAEDRMPQS